MLVNKIESTNIPDEEDCKCCQHKTPYIKNVSWCDFFNSNIYKQKPNKQCLEARMTTEASDKPSSLAVE